MTPKEQYYKYGESLGISINDLQRLKMLADNCQEDMADKKYTEEDMRECWRACLNFNKPAGLDSGINYQDFINSLNKQD